VERTELVAALEDAGLSPYQADAYVTVLEFGAAPATDIAEASGVPDPRIYDVLRDLESKGYIETYEQGALHARIHDLGKLREDLEQRATRFTEAVGAIQTRWEKPEMEDAVVRIVKRFETVLNNAARFVEAAENQVQISVSTEHYRRLRPALQTATENGVNVNLSIFTDGEPDSLPPREDVAAVCTEARHRQLPSPFTAIVDRTKTCFAPHTGSTNEYGIIVDDRTHTYVFHWFFLTTQWDVWEPFYTSSDEKFDRDYIDIRYCVRDIAPLLDVGATVRIRVDGTDTETGEHRTIEGTVSDVIVTGDGYDESVPIVLYGGQVALVVETDDGPVEVGGWGAMVEEVEAHRVQVLSVE